MRSVTALIFICFVCGLLVVSGIQQKSFSQHNIPAELQGNWVAEGSVFSHQIREVRDPDFGFNYLSFRFDQDRFCISYNPFETFRCFSNVEFKQDTLWVLGSPMYLIKEADEMSIELIRINGGVTQRLKKFEESVMVYKTDSLYRSRPGLHPTHSSIFSSIFFFNSLVIYPAPREDQVITIELTVTASGAVRDVEVLSSHSRLRRRWFLRSMLESSGEWIPAKVDGKPVDCRIKLELVRVGYKTLEAEEKAWRYYNYALRQITKKNYPDALNGLNAALVYTPGNPRMLFTRAVCHFYLKDEKKQCEDVIRAKESCPFIPTAMADEELGILVECFKRQ